MTARCGVAPDDFQNQGRSGNGLMVRAGFLALAAVACWTSLAAAQFEDLLGAKFGGQAKGAEFTTTLTPSTAGPGDVVTLTINVKLPKSYYIYSTTGEFEGRTRIETKEVGLEPIDTEFVPDRKPKTAFEPLFKAEVSKFHDHVTWTKKYRLAKDADPAAVAITGQLTGQYCTDGTSEEPGKCVPIRPAYEINVTLVTPPAPFAYEQKPIRGKTNPAVLKFKLSPEDAKPGDKVTLSISIQLDEGWHTFALTQTGGGGEPTTIALDALQGLKAVGADFEPDHPVEIKVEDDLKLQVHHGTITWSRELEVAQGAVPGKYGVRGRIGYQTCKTSCIPTREIAFRLGDIPEESSGAPEAPKGRGILDAADVSPPAGNDVAPAVPAAAPVAQKPQDKGMLAFLIAAIGFGYLSLLTPCVWPMIPITVSFFLKQSESEHHRPTLVALVFCGSIVATFTVLGVGISFVFGAAGLNAIAVNPWLNVVIGAVFIAFALNMLGMFEIRIPSSLLTFTASKEQAGGYLGAMFMALTFTLTSFTCTFAFAGSLLVAAAKGDFYWPTIGMLAFGAAFASPFFVLAMVPSLMKKLPKSGGWMNSVKVVMGLIEVGAAIKFFSVADMMWNPEPVLFDFAVVMNAWLVLSLTIALYLLGIFRLPHDVPPTGISVGRLMLVMLFFGLGCHLAIGLFAHDPGNGWIMDQLVAFAPPRFENEAAMEKGIAPPTDLPEPLMAHHGVWFTLDVDKGIAHASKLQRPMLFDFTGVNCTNCRLMEKRFPKPQNRNLLDKFVLVSLYTDHVPTIAEPKEAKRLLDRNINLQMDWFNDASLPAYAVVSPDGKTILSAYSGLERKDGEFAAFMNEGLKKWEAMRGNALADAPAKH